MVAVSLTVSHRDGGRSQKASAMTWLAWLRLLALDGPLAKAEPRTLRYRTCMLPPGWCTAGGGGASRSLPLALGSSDRGRLGPDHRPTARPLISSKPEVTVVCTCGKWRAGDRQDQNHPNKVTAC